MALTFENQVRAALDDILGKDMDVVKVEEVLIVNVP